MSERAPALVRGPAPARHRQSARSANSAVSGGQQQRAAIARALIRQPCLLLADEPTGNLDSKSTGDVLKLFEELHGEGQTIVLVTHDADVAARAPRHVRLRDGRIEGDDRRG